MSMIINKTTMAVEMQSHRLPGENWNGPEWISVPEAMEQEVMGAAPYCTLEYTVNEDGSETLFKVIALEKPTPEPAPEPGPTLEQRVEDIEIIIANGLGGVN